MKAILFAGAMASVLAAGMALAQSPAETDAAVIKQAAVGNTFEIEESKLAESKATDPRLKNFAKQMIADHGHALKTLESAAGKDGDKTHAMLDKPHQAMLDNLKTFSGTDFDKIYIADQVAAHAETVALLSDYQQNGKTSALASWTKTTLPVVKRHKAEIDAM